MRNLKNTGSTKLTNGFPFAITVLRMQINCINYCINPKKNDLPQTAVSR